jgi:hypothetical protein
MPSQRQAGVNAMGTEGASKNPWIAGILSGVLPGLGQFYNRQWLKGVGFLLGTLVVDGVLGVSAGMIKFFQSGAPPENTGQFLFGSLNVLALVIWSITDAARTAERAQM